MRSRLLAVAAVLITLVLAAPAQARNHYHGHARSHAHVRVGVGFDWGLWWGPGWWGPGWWGPWWYGAGGYGPYGYAPGRVVGTPPSVAAVDTDVSPEHARVYLDGQLIGVADDFDGYPDYLYLEPGTYSLEFRLKGYETEKISIEAKAGAYFPIDFKLKRIPGEAATPWYDRPKGLPVARVWGKDGAKKGEVAPETGEAAPPGEEGPPPAEAAPAPPGPDTRLRPELDGGGAPPAAAAQPADNAALELRVQPDEAAVYLDGKFLGTAGQLARLERGVAVAAGRHTLEVMAPGWTAKKLVFEVAAGERRQVVVELEKETGQNRPGVL
jgi:hypothetical protein